MTLQFDLNKSVKTVGDFLSNPQLFVKIHPAIYKIEPIEGNRYRFFERFDLGIIPYAFSYIGTLNKVSDNQIIMTATVFGVVKIYLQFDLSASENGTLVTETVVFKSFLPVRFIMKPVFRKVHQQMFKNINDY
jgi:carbon monoxide dehydrogenase subunit G